MTRFAIIVPTRNRPESLRMTLLGLALTRHPDVAILVSDNSDPAFHDRNRAILHEALPGREARYVRPDRVLPMAAHWTFAVAAAPEAAFTGIVTDRMTLLPDALPICDQILSETGLAGVCFRNGVVAGAGGTDLPAMPDRIRATTVSATGALADFARARLRKDTPRFLNSFVSRAALDRIRARYPTLFGGISPDYAFAFRFLDTVDAFVHVEAPLLLDHAPGLSNGMAMTRNIPNAAARDFLERVAAEQAAEFAVGPIPHETTLLPNVILREMEIARAEARGATRLPAIDAAAFHEACAKAMRRSIRLGDPHSRRLAHLLEEYRRARGLPPLDARIRRTNAFLAARNSVTGWVGRLRGAAAVLPGAQRDAAGDLVLQGKLGAMAPARLDPASDLSRAAGGQP